MCNSNLPVRWIAVLVFFSFILSPKAQTDKKFLAELVAEDQAAINALVLYPKDTRLAILEATLYPEALIKLESIQSNTATNFRELLEEYPKPTQEMIWDLTRYPDLIHQLALADEGSETAINEVLKDFPEVIHERARQVAINHYRKLIKIDELNRGAESAFEALLKEYPPNTQQALQQLITLPEVLTILTENIRLTILVGDLYRKEPAWLLYKADSISLEVRSPKCGGSKGMERKSGK